MTARTLARVFAALVLPCAAARAQLAATVPASDPVYGLVSELSASLPVRGIITAQRPWSRREVATIALAFQDALDRRLHDTTAARPPLRIFHLLDSLTAAYASEIRELQGEGIVPVLHGALLKEVRLDAIGTNSDFRRVPTTNGLGSIDAFTNPLVEPNWGRPVADGFTGNLEVLSEIGVGSRIALGVQPRFTWLDWRHGPWTRQFDFQRLYARGVIANIALEAGMDEVTWGQGSNRGLLLSANPRPMHQVTLSSDVPLTLPWILRYLGPVQGRLIFANLGKTQNYPGAQLVTYGLGVTPTARLELGAALQDQMGGGGSPPCSVDCRVKDLFPYLFWIKPGSDSQATNKIAQIEARYRIPAARGLSLYYELSMDDFDARRIRSMLWQDSGHLFGISFDRLDPEGRWGLDLQAHHTSLRLYEHPQFTSGVTYRRAIVGDPLGTNGAAGYATLSYRWSEVRALELSGAYESRDPSMYMVWTSGANANGWTFVETQALPQEMRARIGISLRDALIGPGLSIVPTAVVERARNYNFQKGSSRTNFLFGITGRVVY